MYVRMYVYIYIFLFIYLLYLILSRIVKRTRNPDRLGLTVLHLFPFSLTHAHSLYIYIYIPIPSFFLATIRAQLISPSFPFFHPLPLSAFRRLIARNARTAFLSSWPSFHAPLRKKKRKRNTYFVRITIFSFFSF